MTERAFSYGLRPGMALALARLGLWKKLGNYLLAELDLRLGREVLRAAPYKLVIDPASACSLRCPFCPTGRGKGTRPKTLLAWNAYRRIMDELGPYLLQTDFYNWGEPTLNPRLYDMIAYAKRFGMETYLSSHLNDLGADGAEKMLASGLDFLILSFDGASQETYSKYRVGGDFNKALDNLRTLLDLRRRRGSPKPFVAWKFLVFRHNEHEIAAAKAMSDSLGVDLFLPAPAAIPDPDWVPVKEGARFYPERAGAGNPQVLLNEYEYRRAKASGLPACVWPWLAAVVNSDGSVSPCCGTEDRADDLGDAAGAPVREVLNNARARAARAFLARRAGPDGAGVCGSCPHAGKINPLVPSWWRSGKIRDFKLSEIMRPANG